MKNIIQISLKKKIATFEMMVYNGNENLALYTEACDNESVQMLTFSRQTVPDKVEWFNGSYLMGKEQKNQSYF